ncbi:MULTISPECIES: hypothetical protein [unclassified Streptomyces]|uniref:hypothetical protein n=1 Tax=unclassified Streptomyces TaxID=2593676 RepID=UPI0038215479
MQRLVLAAVDPYIDRQVLARQAAREQEQRRALAAFLDGWGAAGGTTGWRGPGSAAGPLRGVTPKGPAESVGLGCAADLSE